MLVCGPRQLTSPYVQVLPCSKRYVHDWTVCPFAHPGEKAKRRDPRVFTYTGVACPDMKKASLGGRNPTWTWLIPPFDA